MRSSQISRYSDGSVPRRKYSQTRQSGSGKSGSLDRRKNHQSSEIIELDPILLAKTPILCNKYVVDKNEITSNNIPGITTRAMEGQGRTPPQNRRAKSLPRTQQYLEPPRQSSPGSSSEGSTRRSPRPKRKKSPG